MRRARDNPFASHCVLGERYRLDDAGWARLIERLEALHWRGAIVGPHGSGKTTLLEDLGARLTAMGRNDVVLVDEADRLSALQWIRLRMRAPRLVVTTHREGRLPLLHRCETSAELLRELTESLGQPLEIEESARLHAAHRGNVRDALRDLYDRWGCAVATDQPWS
jgi:ABC-type glutathione transport system ATPase component